MGKILFVVAAIMGLCDPIVSIAQAPGPTLGRYSRSLALAEALKGIEPRFENGYTLVIDPNGPRALVYGTSGRLEKTYELSLPGAAEVKPYDISTSRNGKIAVTASSLASDGSVASVIFVFEKAGETRLVIRTDPFIPVRVAVSPDGSIWALGKNRDAAKRREDYRVFQKYTPDGRLAGEFVRLSTFPPQVEPYSHGGQSDGGSNFLRATANRMGAYVPRAREWIELDNEGTIIGRWKPRSPFGDDGTAVSGIALTDSGDVYAWLTLDSRRAACKLDKAAGIWVPVGNTEYRMGGGPSPTAARLFGADGQELVFRDLDGRLYWFAQPQ